MKILTKKLQNLSNDKVKEFHKLFAYYLRDLGIKKKKIFQIRTKNIKKQNQHIYFIKNQIIGFLLYEKKINLYQQKVFVINDFFIKPEMRGQYLGSVIIKKIIKDLKKKKTFSIRIEIIEKNKNVLKFWKKFKPMKRGETFSMKVK